MTWAAKPKGATWIVPIRERPWLQEPRHDLNQTQKIIRARSGLQKNECTTCTTPKNKGTTWTATNDGTTPDSHPKIRERPGLQKPRQGLESHPEVREWPESQPKLRERPGLQKLRERPEPHPKIGGTTWAAKTQGITWITPRNKGNDLSHTQK